MGLSLDADAFRSIVRRYRRPLAAASAGLAALITLGLVTGSPDTVTAASGRAWRPGSDEAQLPIAMSGVNAVVPAGSRIDVIALPDNGFGAQIIARDVLVLDHPTGSAVGSTSATVLVLAVTEAEALRLADAAAAGTLTALIR